MTQPATASALAPPNRGTPSSFASSGELPPGSCRGRLLTIGWATSVALWAVAYVAMMKPGLAVGELLVAVMCAVLFGAGIFAARTTHADGTRGGGLASGLTVGAVSAAVNLLLVGSLFGSKDSVVLREAVEWIALLFGTSLFFAGLGGILGGRKPAFRGRLNWPGVFAFVAFAAAFLLLITGGLVTGLRAGLAVPDWPNSFGHNMLLYPLSEMKEGVYFEHAHRLYGMLVGLSSIVLAVLLFIDDRRAWIKAVAVLLVLMVIAQGVLGGLRVTGDFTTSEHASDMRPSTALAMVHGIFGQVTFAVLAVIVAATTRSWLFAPAATDEAAIARDRRWAVLLMALLLVQLFLGVAYRQSRVWGALGAGEGGEPPAWALHGHLTGAVATIALGIFVGVRAATRHPSMPRITALGKAILGILGLQVLLGFGALVAVLVWKDGLPTLGVAITSAHQAVGALLVAHVAMLVTWYFRGTARAGLPSRAAAT